MADKQFPESGLPIRKTSDLLPNTFQTDINDKFMSAVVDPLVQPGKLQKLVGYLGKRYGKTYNGKDVYLDTDQTLRSRYQLEPGVITKSGENITSFHDYLDFKNMLKFFGNDQERDDLITSQEHYSWNPPINWDKFINYREYYWEPSGPPAVAVYGQRATVTSTYKVKQGVDETFIFTPDGLTGNPAITLYRGQEYKFIVNSPGEGLYIRTNYDTGSLIYRPEKLYRTNEYAVYDEKLWQAVRDIPPLDGSTIDLETEDWKFVENIAGGTALEYNDGVTNNGIANGTLTFKVPYDAPDVLYYQSLITPNRFGRFIIADIESNTFIDIENEVLGKTTYTSSNGVAFTNGLVVEFQGNITPAKYASESWLIEGVGDAITLTKFSDLIVPVLTTDTPEVLFDNEGFDTDPFDDATAYPSQKDYLTISRDSQDTNPWSRYNRWFHRSVLEYAYTFRGQDFPATESSRAKRPIIEFKPNLQLFNHGSTAKQTVDYVDDFTTDVFSNIEGSTGYNIDGEDLFEGARILVVADTDDLANNKIYYVDFIDHNGRNQISLRPSTDSASNLGECVLCRRGTVNGGKMFHFDGTKWVKSQEKTKVNQAPLFDAYDENGVSFNNADTYPVSTFIGTNLLSYKLGNSITDTELGFSLAYQNIDNIGDILFTWDWENDSFTYSLDFQSFTKNIQTGYYKIDGNYANGWIKTNNELVQPIVDNVKILESTNKLTFNSVDWSKESTSQKLIIKFYLNGKDYTGTYTRNRNVFTFSQTFVQDDVVVIKIITDLEPVTGYYEIPLGLEKNPLNEKLGNFTFGEAIDHIGSSVEFDERFSGNIPGLSNLRDLDDYQKNAKRFLKHSGCSPLAIHLLTDKENNIIKSLQYARKAYTDFKNNFLIKATELDYNDNLIDFVDDIISDLTKTKNSDSPFSDSDVLGTGAYTKISYEVEDTGIKTFALSEKFDLITPSRKAVYVYLNNVQLLNSRDYTFDSTFGFVRLTVNLSEGDKIEIREYLSTASGHVPPTPTSMGMYKKYTPIKFIDDTYTVPREVIQGHDGSIIKSYGDYRDELLLELEFRIYNNIKEEYDYELFDIDNIVGGYYGYGLYEKPALDDVVATEFLKWVQNSTVNYTENEYLDTENSFTYTYSNMTDPTRTKNLPGYWRGVYRWFYDTDRPHRCPWEMLGFSEKPTWWEEEYGPAPYTSGNLVLWEDLANGEIKHGNRAGIYNRYKRSTLLTHIPVDGDGRLLSPLDSGLANDFTLINNTGPFKLGDVGPVEYAWRSSSEYPFAVVLAMCLLKPFEFITDSFDRSRTKLNILEQTVNSTSNVFQTINDLIIPDSGVGHVIGLSKYLIGYIKSRGRKTTDLDSQIKSIDVNLSARLSGFVDKAQTKYLLDSKNPKSTSSSIFVPAENYNIIFNVSSPIASVAYSGVILEKTEGGWTATGYDDINPVFNYYKPLESPNDPAISVGGVSEEFTDWEANKLYNNGVVVRYRSAFYRSITTHTGGDDFEERNWKKLPEVPTVNDVRALRRKSFNRTRVSQVAYGTKLTTIQAVVDLLLGYQEWLKDQGFVFDRYDPQLGASQDWVTSSKEFMFWTKHNWEIGSLITLSPAAEKIDVEIPVGVSDNILDGFYDYQVLKDDGKPLEPQFINVNRQFQNVVIEPTNTTNGIYYIKLFYVLKEHVTVFDDRTVFNDVIYDQTTGYRQERIKTQAFRTVDWDGDYTSPGFLFDNVNIQVWQPFTDYKLGDIVSYRSYNWTSLINQLGTETFNDTYWTKLDSSPEKQLVPNFDYRINQFDDYYDVNSEGVGANQRRLARHSVGYQSREYLENLAEDSITQFQLYQGFIREKGTNNAVTKVFNKLSRAGASSVKLNEEWAFLVGKFGGIDQLKELEFNIEKDQFSINPQPILFVSNLPSNVSDQYYRILETDFSIKPLPFTVNVNPTSYDADPTRVAGYVRTDNVQHKVKNRDDILNLDIETFLENDHIWITFDNNYSWDVLRFNKAPELNIIGVTKTDATVEVELNRIHDLQVNEIVGIKKVDNLTGFYKITATGKTTITVSVDATIQNPDVADSTLASLYLLTNARFESYTDLDQSAVALLKSGSKFWIDNDGSNKWEVIEKKQQYTSKSLLEYGTTTPLNTGYKVLYDDLHKLVISSIPGSGLAMTYIETTAGLSLKQIISPPSGFTSEVVGSFGKEMKLSPDGRFLIISAPEASGIDSYYKGNYNPSASYQVNDIVLYSGKLWKCINDVAPGDGSSIDLNTQDWEPATIIDATNAGRGSGYTNQGFITIYEYVGQQWVQVNSFVSPRPNEGELFGTSVTISQSGTNYYMAVSAPGSVDGRGRVYLYKYNGTSWSHLENANYAGIYNPSSPYIAGSIVWHAGDLWQAKYDNPGDGSTITIESNDWLLVDPISTQCSLPTNISVNDDGSTLALGLIGSTQVAELIKQGDDFGHSMAMNRDGSILAIGLPKADGQYFANYRGHWRPDIEYIEGEVVKYQDMTVSGADAGDDSKYQYYKLVDSVFGADSTLRSYNEDPTDSSNWQQVGDSTTQASGKVFIYQRNENDLYEFKQTITAGSLDDINDLDTTSAISSGDQFGHSINVDYTGTTLIITSPKADINLQNQGSAYIFRTAGFASLEYRLKQKIESYERFPNEYFGQSICMTPAAEKIVIGAKDSTFVNLINFDSRTTSFDENRTRIVEEKGYAGAVYVYEKKGDTYFLAEKLDTDLTPYENFGFSLSCTYSTIVVGSPKYKSPIDDSQIGYIRLFKKDSTVNSLQTLASQQPTVDLSMIKSIVLYDNINNIKIQDLDYVDHAKLKVLNSAEQEISFKTIYDPAIYNVGTEEQNVIPDMAWTENNVGKIWWNISTAKWVYHEQGDLSYRIGHWNTLATGASIDIYEWVETPLLPSEWAVLADTNDGLAEGISGQPLYPNDNVYSVKELYNPTTGVATETLYYYWVKNSVVVPNVLGRNQSASAVASLINNPGGSGVTFISLIDSDKFLTYNFDNVLDVDTATINVQYYKNNSGKATNLVHKEYQLLTEGDADSLPTVQLENKWIDSLVGRDLAGNRVPDSALPAKQQYGLNFRPRQTMFVNRIQALKNLIVSINSTLTLEPFADIINFANLNLVDTAPNAVLNLYDTSVDTYADLAEVGTSRVTQATLRVNIVDGEIDTIDVTNPGFGYRVIPPVEFEGNGIGAKAVATIDTQGRVTGVAVTNRGRKYSSCIAKIRPFSVLVETDSTASNFWSIYSWDETRKVFFRTRSQAYETTRYWNLIDWWKTGYGVTSRIVKEIGIVAEEAPLTLETGDLLRIKEYGTGGWAVFEKTAQADNFSDAYVLVGRQNGTIALSSSLYDTQTVGIGYDTKQSFDAVRYDLENSLELRNILKAIKEDIFINDYAVEWNKLFFASVRYVFAEQQYVDWAFKTSFLNAIHNVGDLEQKTNYKNDNLESYQQYIDEIKPYRTTVREYVSLYKNIENTNSAIADFDLPPAYIPSEGKAIPIRVNNETIDTYPWKWWKDNNGYSIVSISVSNAGADYTQPPSVLIQGDGTGAEAIAYISNGTVSGITVTNSGSGYTKAPTVSLVGGNPSSSTRAKAIAIIGNTKARTFGLGVKFDRVNKVGIYSSFTQSETIIATGNTAVFDLKYAPTRDKSKITITKNGQVVLPDEFSISLYKSEVDTYKLLKGKLNFTTVPRAGDVIAIAYEKNDELLDAVNRINKYYSPTSGMRGDDLSQLMTGIDFGGVQVQGTTFDVTGGWDALPWFTDSWDSVETTSDYYVVVDGSTNSVTLPYIPAIGQEINIYLKRSGSQRAIRIDDPNFGSGSPAIPAVPGVPADAEYNNGAIINVTGNGSDFFKREVTTNGVRIMGAGTVGGQTAVPDAWLEKVARMVELFTDPTGAGINEEYQRNLIKNLSGDAGTYHAGLPTIQRVARGAGADYTPNFLTDEGVVFWNLTDLFDTHVQNDMVWYLNSTGDGYGDGDTDAQEVIEHVFHTLHMHGLPAEDIKLYPFISADWQSGDLYAAMEEAYDAGKWDPSGYQSPSDDWKTNADAFEVAAKEYLYLLNFCMFEYTELWDGGSLAPEWTDDMRTQAGILANNPLGYAFHNTYIATIISKPSLATIRSIFQDGNTPAQDNPALAGVSGYVVDALVGGSPAIPAVPGLDSSSTTNPNAEMPTFYGDGSTTAIDIGVYVQTNAGDTLIFRPTESDGSVTISDPNIVDTNVSGGTLSAMSGAYATATGLTAEEITIDGSGFITPDQVPAPEENIPGQVLDSVSIKVFNSTPSGAAPLQSRTVVSNGTTSEYSIGLEVIENSSVLVYVDKIKKTIATDYTINLSTNSVTFTSPPASGAIVEIIAIGRGGVALLDYQEYTADGETNLFLTAANFADTDTVFVTVNGVHETTATFANSSDLVEVEGKSIIQFGQSPAENSIVKIICFGANSDVDLTGLSVVRVNQQQITFDGSTRSLSLDNFVNLTRASAQSAIVVEVNNTALRGVDTIYSVYDGVTNSFTLGQDPLEGAGAILNSNITVLVNNEVKIPVQDYVYDGTTKILTYNSTLNVGDIIKIENNLRSQYTVSGNNLVIEGTVSLSEGDSITVTWFSEYPSMQVNADEYVGGKINYQLKQVPLNASHVWVYKNGIRLTKDEDYLISLPRSVLYLKEDSTSSDLIKIIAFSANTYNEPSAYEIHKDMLNVYRFKRYSKDREVKLARELKYYDQEIVVTDASNLTDPIPLRNIPGIVEIENERIEYLSKSGNTLSQLRRGSAGTAIGETYAIGSYVIDLGSEETIPYNETQNREDFVSDGSSLLIGPLDFLPPKAERTTWYRSTIPTDNGPCDQIEVFAGGSRLRKDPIDAYSESLGASSPTADIKVEAEFSVDGTSSYIRLTNPLPAGTRVSVIRKTGRIWYDRGDTTASTGVTLLDNTTPIARFIADRTTNLPE